MVKHCAYGKCKNDTRYFKEDSGVLFFAFPKPKTNLGACLRWIKLCGRPHDQLNTERVYTHFFYKQPDYKQRGLNSDFLKELSPQIFWT